MREARPRRHSWTPLLLAIGVAAPWLILAISQRPTSPTVSRDKAEQVLVQHGEPTKVRAYYTTLAGSARMMTGGDPASAFVVNPGQPPVRVSPDPDTRVWLVVARMPAGHGPKPSLAAGSTAPDPHELTNFFTDVDATTGRSYNVGAIGGEWPRRLPRDNLEDLLRDAMRWADGLERLIRPAMAQARRR